MSADRSDGEDPRAALLPGLEWCGLCDEPFDTSVLHQQAWDEHLGLMIVEQRCLDRARTVTRLFDSP